MRSFLVVAAALSVLALSGCKSECRKLSEKLCECEENTPKREACIQRIATEASRVTISDAQEKTCKELNDANACDCHNLDTLEGKQACGLAY